jgi:hypothetical protein
VLSGENGRTSDPCKRFSGDSTGDQFFKHDGVAARCLDELVGFLGGSDAAGLGESGC